MPEEREKPHRWLVVGVIVVAILVLLALAALVVAGLSISRSSHAQTAAAAAQTQVSAISAKASELDTRVLTLERTAQGTSAAIGSLQTSVSSLQAEIAALQGSSGRVLLRIQPPPGNNPDVLTTPTFNSYVVPANTPAGFSLVITAAGPTFLGELVSVVNNSPNPIKIFTDTSSPPSTTAVGWANCCTLVGRSTVVFFFVNATGGLAVYSGQGSLRA